MSSHKPARAAASQLRLTGADFDAFSETGCTPEAPHGRPPDRPPDAARRRVELRQRVLAWARGVVARLEELDIPVQADEQLGALTSLRLSFVRDGSTRAQLGRMLPAATARLLGDGGAESEVSLALLLDSAKVAVFIELPAGAALDASNLRACLADAARARELTEVLLGLPEQFALSTTSTSDQGEQALRAEAAGVARTLARADKAGDALWIGWRVPREIAVRHSALLDEQLEDAIVALGAVYKLIAWAPGNDALGIEGDRDDANNASSRSGERSRRDRRETKAKRRGREEETEVSRRHGKRAPARESAPASARHVLATRPLLRATIRSSLRSSVPRSTLARPPRAADAGVSVSVERGTRVRVLSGPFVGKVGIVQELDGKGGARVMLGLLATRLDVKDLALSAEGRERPSLATSHRKPIPVR